jgi:hypothetical protein
MFVIDYVVVHELAHLIESNHTSRFWECRPRGGAYHGKGQDLPERTWPSLRRCI